MCPFLIKPSSPSLTKTTGGLGLSHRGTQGEAELAFSLRIFIFLIHSSGTYYMAVPLGPGYGELNWTPACLQALLFWSR